MTEDVFEFDYEVFGWKTTDGRYWIDEADVHAGGLKWRVHLSDPDPFPSSPHAHCIAGQERYVGCKLHLGTGVLYANGKPWKRLDADSFLDLIEKIKPKFPNIELPIPTS